MRTRCRARRKSELETGPKKRALNPYTRMVAHFAYLQQSEMWTEWSFRMLSGRQAQILVDCGEAMWITRGVDTPEGTKVMDVGIRALSPTSWERPSPATLTFATLNAVAKDACGKDADKELTRRERNEVLKFKVWPLIGDTKAVAVRPRISEADRRMAETLLQPRRSRGRWNSDTGRTQATGMLAA